MEQIHRALTPEALALLKQADAKLRTEPLRQEMRAIARQNAEAMVGNRKARRRAKALARA